MFQYFEWLLLAFPALGALLNGLLGKRLSPRVQSWIACGALVGSLLVALPLFAAESLDPGLVGHPVPLPWFNVWSGRQFVEGPFALRIDALSILAALTAIVVGLFIHVQTSLHTKDLPSRHVTLALLNGTLAVLLALVLADNFLLLLLAWSLTSWCTYGLFRTAPDQEPPGPSSQMPHLFSDLCLLLAVATMSRVFDSLTLYDIISMKPATGVGPPLEGAAVAVPTLLTLAAAVRIRAVPFYAWFPEDGPSHARATAHALTSTLPGVYLLARVYPLFQEAPAALALLSWWGALTALLVGLAALAQSQLFRWSNLVASAQAGLILLALGAGAYPVVFCFLPAYVLQHTLLQFVAKGPPRPKSRRRHQGPRWMVFFALATVAGVPLLPGFAFHAQLLEALTYGSKALWILAVLALLLLAAGSARVARLAGAGPNVQSGDREATSDTGVLFLTVSGIAILGLINLAAPPPLAGFLEPIFIQAGYQPPWWWFGITALIAALGAGLGYVLASRASANWLSSQQIRSLYDALLARPVLAAGKWLAEGVEPRATALTFGALARLVNQGTREETENGSISLSLFLLFLGVAAIVAYLLIR